MKELIEKYKTRIAHLQKSREHSEQEGLSGACISITGRIEAYSAVIKDLENLIKEDK